MQRNKTNDGSARLQSLTVLTYITSVGDILDKDWHFFAQRPLTRLRQISKERGLHLNGFSNGAEMPKSAGGKYSPASDGSLWL